MTIQLPTSEDIFAAMHRTSSLVAALSFTTGKLTNEVSLRGEIRLSDDVIREMPADELGRMLPGLIAESVTRDLDELLLNGKPGRADPFLALLSGLLDRATHTSRSLASVLRSIPSDGTHRIVTEQELLLNDDEVEARGDAAGAAVRSIYMPSWKALVFNLDDVRLRFGDEVPMSSHAVEPDTHQRPDPGRVLTGAAAEQRATVVQWSMTMSLEVLGPLFVVDV